MLIDSSSLKPIGHVENRSKVNLCHGLLVRNVCAALRTPGHPATLHDIGVIAPYRPQVTLIEDLLEEAGLSDISVGTAHRFQGAERDTIIVDLTESDPHVVGAFLGATSLREAGAKLLNVSLSRAHTRLIVVANLSYLRSSLSEHHVLHGVLRDIESRGCIIDSRDVIPDAVTAQVASQATSRLCASLPQRFDSETFLPGISADLLDARRSVVCSSPQSGVRSAHIFATILKPLVARGVRVEVVMNSLHARAASEESSILLAAGVQVTLHEDVAFNSVVIDDENVWLGATPPLECVEAREVTMVRVVSSVAARILTRLVCNDTHHETAPPALVANT
jgi:hypothetical protein